MKIALLIFALALTLISGDVNKALTNLKTRAVDFSVDCVNASDIDMELVEKALEGEIVDDPKFLNFCFCLGKELEFIDDDGKFTEQNFLTEIVDHLKNKFNSCVEEGAQEVGGEKRSFTFTKCLHNLSINGFNFTENAKLNESED